MQQDEVDSLVKDKTDFQKRLKLIAELRKCTDEHSTETLLYLMKHDFVYKVRLAAWHALTEQGITCDKPVERPRYAIVLEKSIQRMRRFMVWAIDITAGFW